MFRIRISTNIIAANLLAVILLASAALGQTPSPSPEEEKWGDFGVKSSIEFGFRGRNVDGSENKFRSDWNYKTGFRVFNSSFALETEDGKGKLFDSVVVNSSGWGADPSGMARVTIQKTGVYRLDTNIRRITYFNALNNHALGQHSKDAKNKLGDFALTVFPESRKLQFDLGYSYGRYKGPGFTNARNYRDDFMTAMDTDVKSNDFRGGARGELSGFRWAFTQGYRRFRDRSELNLDAPTIGNNPSDTTVFNLFSRIMPVNGESYFSIFDLTRNFAKRFDFTARLIYVDTKSGSRIEDRFNGRDNNNNFIDLDLYETDATAKRIQTRGDIGLTWRATDAFTLSNTFSFDQFEINGFEALTQTLTSRNSAGVVQPIKITTSEAARKNHFRRYSNLFEGDYQFNNRVSFHAGYRYTRRMVTVDGYDLNILSSNNPATVNNPLRQCPYTGAGTPNPRIFCEDEENTTHTFLAGGKVKARRHWAFFWDIEKGEADNVFTRVENYSFTNFRVRNQLSFNKFSMGLSAIVKNNSNPAQTDAIPPEGFGADVKSRIYSANFDWAPRTAIILSGGYTYTHQTATTPIYIRRSFPPVSGTVRVLGRSEYYVRDHYAFIDASVSPHRRVTLYGAYRISRDTGQGDRPLTDPYPILIASSPTAVLAQPELIILSYPMKMQSPEVKAAFRINRKVDWNIGYQYFNYRERFQSVQDYRAHLPYTSLTIYLGREPDGR